MRVRVGKRIARSLVTVTLLSILNVVGAPIIAPTSLLPLAKAATLDTTGMILNWDMSNSSSYSGQGATTVNDLSSNSSSGTVTQVGSTTFPTFTNTAPKYLTIAGNSVNYNHIRSVDLKGKLDQSTPENMQNISIFAWVYPTANGIVVDEINANNGWQDSQIEMADGKFSFRVWNSAELISDTNSPLQYWYYVGLVYNFGTKTLTGYINGREVGKVEGLDRSAPWETDPNYTVHYSVGRYDGTNLGSGSGGNFRFGALHVFKTPISTSTILNNYQAGLDRFGPTTTNPSNASNLVNRNSSFSVSSCAGIKSGSDCTYIWEESINGGSSWTTVGTSSNVYTTPTLTTSYNGRIYRLTATDAGVSGNVPTAIRNYAISSAATLTVSTPPGSDTDTAMSFNGTSQYLRAPDANSLDISDSITVQAWVYQTASIGTGWNMVVNKEDSYELGTVDGIWHYAIRGPTVSWSGVNTGIPSKLNEWQHIAFTRAAGTNSVKFYLNGNLVFSGSADGAGTGLINNSTHTLTVSGRDGANGVNWISSYFPGQIDELRIYASDRTQQQIIEDMHSYGPISTPTLRLYYDFNEGSGSSTVYNRKIGALAESDLTIYNSAPFAGDSITATSINQAYTVQRFFRSYITTNNGWKVPTGVSRVSALVVAGGGGGGSRVGGGGGAGGYSLSSVLTLTPNQVENITVGQGGVGAQRPTINEYQGRDGQNSSLSSRVTVIGGGGGGGYDTSSNTPHQGRSGGSGGGAAPHLTTAGTWPAGVGAGTNGQGFNGGSGFSGTSYPAGGGGGAASVGGTATSSSVSGAGGSGILDPLSGSNLCLASGGGGGVGNLFSGSSGGAAGTCSGGISTASAGTKGQVVPANASANSGSGGGGAGYVASNSNDVAGGNGGSGIVIIRWITATAPIFTGPASDTLTAGMVETFTVGGTPNSPLTRNYRWQVSSDTGTSWVNATTGTGFTSASYTTPILETSTSGTRYRYRVVVTDSDTAGLSIVDTSTVIVFLTINPRITITGSSVSLSQKYGETQTVTYTIANGTGTRTTVASPNNRTGITWSSVSGSAATLGIGAGVGFGTYYETLTVTDSVTATTTQMITIAVSKADTITVTSAPVTMTYSGAQANSAYTVTGLQNSETATATVNYSGVSPTVLASTTTAPANAGNYRATPSAIVLSGSGSVNNYQNVLYESATVTINKANQARLTIGQYDAFPGISTYPLNVYGGTGLGAVTRTLVTTGTANCTLSNSMFITALNPGICSVRAVKSGGINYLDETTTATIYWIQFVTNYANGAAGGSTGITLTGETSIIKRSYETFTVLSFADETGTAVTSIKANTKLRVIGTGFVSTDTGTEVYFGLASVPQSGLTFNTVDPMANYVLLTVPADAETDRVLMYSAKGWATSPGTLTILP